jgi:hypothetical protein
VSFAIRTKPFPAGSLVLPGSHAGGGDAPSGYIAMILPNCSMPAVQITQQPEPIVAYRGQDAQLTAAATGEGMLRYTWRKGATELADGDLYAGAFTPQLTIRNVTWNSAGTYQLSVSDVWSAVDSVAVTVTVATPCDYDHDGDVDQEDFAHLQLCMGSAPGNPTCQDARLDGDNDVDADDFALFLACMYGPGVPVPPVCAQP